MWYLPRYGFRIVIRNIPRKKILSDINYRVFIRKKIPTSIGSSVITYDDKQIYERNEFFLFPKNDQTLLCFKLKRKTDNKISLIQTDKLGKDMENFNLNDFDLLIVDYFAKIQNFFNFNIKLSKRVEITSSSLCQMFENIKNKKEEQQFTIDRIRDVG